MRSAPRARARARARVASQPSWPRSPRVLRRSAAPAARPHASLPLPHRAQSAAAAAVAKNKFLEGQAKRSENPSVDTKVLVPEAVSGLIIGRGGEHIKKIQNESSARLGWAETRRGRAARCAAARAVRCGVGVAHSASERVVERG